MLNNTESFVQSNMADELRIEGINCKGYGIIPKFVMLDPDISIEAKGIYSYFCSYAGSGNSAFPGWKKIVSDLKLNKDSYYKHYSQLTACGYISVTQESAGGRGQGFKKNIYTIVSSPEKFNVHSCDAKLEKSFAVIRCSGLKALGFGFIAKSVMLDERLSIKAKALYSYLCSFSGAGDCAFPKREDILYHLSISHNSFNKYIKELTTLNYINVMQRQVNGRLCCNDYIIVDKPDCLNPVTGKIIVSLQEPKFSESQRNTEKQKPKIQEAQIQEAQIQETQISESNINNKKNNNSKNNKSIKSSSYLSSEINDEKTEGQIDLIRFDILKEKNIPASYLKDSYKTELAVRLLCDYSDRSVKENYSGLKNGEFLFEAYMLFTEALTGLLVSNTKRKFDGRTVDNATVREKLGRYISFSQNGSFSIAELLDNAVELYMDASRITVPRYPVRFMQRMIWNAMLNGSIKTESAIIHDFDQENGESF